MPQVVVSFFRRSSVAVAALWLLFQCLWYARFGFVFNLEATKYIDEANHVLAHHQLSQFRYLFYLVTIGVIAFSLAAKIGLSGALLVIMALNLWAYLYFYRSLRRFFSHPAPAVAAVALLLSFWPYQSWSLFLFTECTFYSFVLFLLGFLLQFQRLNARFSLGAGAWLLLLMLSRPLGILFVSPVLLFVFLKLRKKQRIAFALAGLGFLLLLNFVVQVVFTTTPDWNMTRALTEESIICDMPRGNAAASLDLSESPNQFYRLLYYVTHNFGHFAGLALTRLRYFFTLVRDYYSTGHNLYLLTYLIFFYGSALWGIKRILRRLPPAFFAFVISSVVLFAATIALQCDDYHNRFFLALTPIFVLFTVVAWQPLILRVSSFAERRKG